MTRRGAEEILAEYTRLATSHGEALEAGHTDAANELNLKLIALFKELVGTGKRGRLAGLLTHPDRSVRCWAAIHTLGADAARAIRTLEALARGSGPIACNALVFSREWANGSLRIEGDDSVAPTHKPG